MLEKAKESEARIKPSLSSHDPLVLQINLGQALEDAFSHIGNLDHHDHQEQFHEAINRIVGIIDVLRNQQANHLLLHVLRDVSSAILSMMAMYWEMEDEDWGKRKQKLLSKQRLLERFIPGAMDLMESTRVSVLKPSLLRIQGGIKLLNIPPEDSEKDEKEKGEGMKLLRDGLKSAEDAGLHGEARVIKAEQFRGIKRYEETLARCKSLPSKLLKRVGTFLFYDS
jgi:hypothetical protein